MNTQVAAAGNAAVDWFKTSKPSGKFMTLDPNESLAEGIGSSYGVIGYKGKIFSLRLRGEHHLLLRPDDGTPIGYIDVVILRQAKVKAKSFYPGGYEEGGSAGKRPDCASIDGVRPDADVLKKQSELCALCPKNEWRTDQNGRKGQECTDYKRLAVFLLPQQTVRFLGQPHMEPVFLRIPPASLSPLAVFGENMANQGWPYSSFITRIMFDATVAHPAFTFKALQKLTDAEADLILGMREEMIAKRITGEDEIARRAAGTAALGGPTQSGATQLGLQAMAAAGLPAGAPNGTAPSPAVPAGGGIQASPSVVAQQQAPPPPPASPPATVVEALPNPALAFGVAPPPPTLAQDAQTAARITQTIEMQPQPGQAGAFSMTLPADEPATTQVQPGAMVGQTVDDVGAAAEDPDLDAKIAAMLAM